MSSDHKCIQINSVGNCAHWVLDYPNAKLLVCSQHENFPIGNPWKALEQDYVDAVMKARPTIFNPNCISIFPRIEIVEYIEIKYYLKVVLLGCKSINLMCDDVIVKDIPRSTDFESLIGMINKQHSIYIQCDDEDERYIQVALADDKYRLVTITRKI